MPVILLIDNFDSFSHMLADYLRRAGVDLEIRRNNVLVEELNIHQYTGVVLSPGPGRPEAAGNLMAILDFFHDKLPILGVCLGHQAIGQYFGAQLKEGNKPMHGKVSRVTQVGEGKIFPMLPDQFGVTRYHSLILEGLPMCLELTILGPNGEVMGLRHRLLPIVGIQFHPEAHLTEHGEEIIGHWVRQTQSRQKEEILIG
jgi:anthranilate synthase component II